MMISNRGDHMGRGLDAAIIKADITLAHYVTDKGPPESFRGSDTIIADY
jgi:hypothetical protein